MSKKVKVAVFDNDLTVRTKGSFPLTDDGLKIKIKKGGKGHFYPIIDPERALEFPLPWYRGGGYEKVYFVRNHASQCVNFGLDPSEIHPPDPEQIIDAANSALIKNFGTEKQELTWQSWLQIILLVLIFLYQLGVL